MFSEAVDSVIAITGRFDRKQQIVDWMNAAIQETITAEGKYFQRDFLELQIPLTGADPLVWTYPAYFRKLYAVQFPDGSYPPSFQPGRVLNPDNDVPLLQYYYMAASYATFVGVNQLPIIVPPSPAPSVVNIGYFRFLQRLKYKLPNVTAPFTRPAVWDDETGWTFYVVNGVDYSLPANQQTGIDLVSNWVLQNYREMLMEGTLAKVWNAMNNNDRAKTAYATYKNMQKNLFNNELFLSVPLGNAYA